MSNPVPSTTRTNTLRIDRSTETVTPVPTPTTGSFHGRTVTLYEIDGRTVTFDGLLQESNQRRKDKCKTAMMLTIVWLGAAILSSLNAYYCLNDPECKKNDRGHSFTTAFGVGYGGCMAVMALWINIL